MDFEKVLLSRKSCREYTDRPVEDDKLYNVVTAASLAPLGLPKNGKPHITIVTDKDMLKALGSQFGPDKDIIYGAPALIIASCPPAPMEGVAQMNAACVVEMMALQATNEGLGNIYLYGVTAALAKNEDLMKQLGIPEGFVPLSALALGYGKEDVSECKVFEATLSQNRY